MRIEHFLTSKAWPAGALRLPRLQAHRGYWVGGAQENTLEAFREARKQGYVMFECDVQLSKDLVPIVFHDQDLKRVAKRDVTVAELTAKELGELTQAPTLEQVLTEANIPHLVNIELKTVSSLNESLERRVCDLVKRLKVEKRVMFSSFNPTSIWKTANYAPKIPRALLVSSENVPENSFVLRDMWLAPFLPFHMLHLEHTKISQKGLKILRKNQVPVTAWTVNSVEHARELLRLGVSCVITDSIRPNDL